MFVISGRFDVYMTGPSGREILLYSVTPGETRVQTTLGLLGEEDYSAEAVAETDIEIVIIPRPMFLGLIGISAVPEQARQLEPWAARTLSPLVCPHTHSEFSQQHILRTQSAESLAA